MVIARNSVHMPHCPALRAIVLIISGEDHYPIIGPQLKQLYIEAKKGGYFTSTVSNKLGLHTKEQIKNAKKGQN
jgi:hypothetical protein